MFPTGLIKKIDEVEAALISLRGTSDDDQKGGNKCGPRDLVQLSMEVCLNSDARLLAGIKEMETVRNSDARLLAGIKEMETVRIKITRDMYKLNAQQLAYLRGETQRLMESCDTIIDKLKDCEPLGKVDEDEEQVRGDGLRILDKNDKKKSNSPNNKEMWWKNCDDEDPITLEPIADLAVPPFMLHSLPFDSKALSAYCVARSMFQNPLTRTPMTFADCQALDVHVEQHHGRGEGGGVKVSEAFRLHESIRVKGSEGGEGGEGDVTGGGEAVARRQEEVRRYGA
jgi:hypothetical protein